MVGRFFHGVVMDTIAEETRWIPVTERMPENGEVVDWIQRDGTQINKGTFIGNGLWYLPDSTMYTYAEIKFWRVARED